LRASTSRGFECGLPCGFAAAVCLCRGAFCPVELSLECAHDAAGGVRQCRFSGCSVRRGRQSERHTEVDPAVTVADSAVPTRPHAIAAGDRTRYDRDAGAEVKADGSAPWFLQAAVPAALPFRVDPDGLALFQAPEHHADGLRVDLVAAHGKRLY